MSVLEKIGSIVNPINWFKQAKHIFGWIGAISITYDWDNEHSITILLEKQLERSKRYFEKDSVTNKGVIEEVSEALDLIKRFKNSSPTIDAISEVENKWNTKLDYEWKEVRRIWSLLYLGRGTAKLIDIVPVFSRNLTEEEKELFERDLREAEARKNDEKQEYWENIMNLIKNRGRGWWG